VVVAVSARNEAERIGACLSSLAAQAVHLRVLVSDNASNDDTGRIAASFSDRLEFDLRTTGPLGACEHLVSTGRWALAEQPDAELFALLAGDDEWGPDFARSALATLQSQPAVAAAFPAFEWVEHGRVVRELAPFDFLQRSGSSRRRRALLVPDRRELANLMYGVYRRQAFQDLLTAWEQGGDDFGADYAAVWSLLGSHRVAACSGARGRRYVRPGADLIERAWGQRSAGTGVIAQGWFYLRLNLRLNRLIATALARVSPDAPRVWRVQLLRSPQWIGGIFYQVARRRLASPATPSRDGRPNGAQNNESNCD
jgi:hypothetical protein